MTLPLDWRDEARRLHAEGWTVWMIAKHIKQPRSTVHYVVNPVAKTKARATNRAQRAAKRVASALPKPPKMKIDNLALAREFAAGAFDRAEFSRRLRGQG